MNISGILAGSDVHVAFVIRCREEMLLWQRQTAAPHLCGSHAFKLPVILQSARHVPDSLVLSDCYAEQLKNPSQSGWNVCPAAPEPADYSSTSCTKRCLRSFGLFLTQAEIRQ